MLFTFLVALRVQFITKLHSNPCCYKLIITALFAFDISVKAYAYIVRVTVNNNCMRLLSVLHIGITFCRRAVLVFAQK